MVDHVGRAFGEMLSHGAREAQVAANCGAIAKIDIVKQMSLQFWLIFFQTGVNVQVNMSAQNGKAGRGKFSPRRHWQSARVEAMQPSAILDCIDDVDTLDKVARRTFGLNDVPLSGFSLNVLNLGSRGLTVGKD